MKHTVLLAIALIIGGCVATTTGISDKDNRSIEPIMMSYLGGRIDCMNKLHRQLVEMGFQINQRDTVVGIIDTKPKALLSDESYSTALMVGTANQFGRVSFVIDRIDSLCTVAMRTYLSVGQIVGDEPLPQGHPLPMKLKRLIAGIPGFNGGVH